MQHLGQHPRSSGPVTRVSSPTPETRRPQHHQLKAVSVARGGSPTPHTSNSAPLNGTSTGSWVPPTGSPPCSTWRNVPSPSPPMSGTSSPHRPRATAIGGTMPAASVAQSARISWKSMAVSEAAELENILARATSPLSGTRMPTVSRRSWSSSVTPPFTYARSSLHATARPVEVEVEPVKSDPEQRNEGHHEDLLENNGGGVQSELFALRRDLEIQSEVLAQLAMQQRRMATGQQQMPELLSIVCEWDEEKIKIAAMDSSLAKMREEINSTRELQRQQGSQVEMLVREIRSNVDSLREETRGWANSSDEVRTLQRETAAAVRATQEGLRREICDASLTLKEEMRCEVHNASLALAEADADLRADLQVTRMSEKQLEPLSAKVDGLRMELSQLKAAAARDHASMRTAVDGVCRDVARLGVAAAEENTHDRMVEEVVRRAATVDGGGGKEAAAAAAAAAATAAAARSAGVATLQDVQDVWDVLGMLRASLQARGSAEDAEKDTSRLEAEGRGLSLLARLQALENQGDAQKMLAVRVGGLAEAFRRCLQECQGCGSKANGFMSEVNSLLSCLAGGSVESSPRGVLRGSGEGTTPSKPQCPGSSSKCGSPSFSASIRKRLQVSVDGHSGDGQYLTPATVSQLPTPQSMSMPMGFESHLPAKECIRV